MKQKQLKILGVIGDPLSHSLSPLMHNAALATLKLPYIYMPFSIKKEALADFFKSLSERAICGFNVTIPHKQSVIPYLHSLSREARLIGAVNTVLVRGKKLIGYNTDGSGFLTSLEKEAQFQVRGKQVILLGAGGAARAIGVALGMDEAREVTIINRTAKKAFDLAAELGKKFPKTIFSVSPLDQIETSHWGLADLLVNATSMGLKGTKLWDLPLNHLPSHALITDIVYNPLETPLLKKAKKSKFKILPGWGMLLYQGMDSFEIWTKKKPPYEAMKKALLEGLAQSKL